jgi:protein subunit release factor B
MTKELLLSVTAKDCEWSYTKGSGAGGQKRNKTSSAVHCFHRPSGAHGYSEASRSQHDNKRDAFLKMAETKEFKNWLKIESAKKTGVLEGINQKVDSEMRRIKVEVKENGLWKEVDKNTNLED